MHAALLTLHAPLASAYFGGFDYDVTHFIRGLNNGGLLNTLFWWVTFTGSITFMVLSRSHSTSPVSAKKRLSSRIVFIIANVSRRSESTPLHAHGRTIWACLQRLSRRFRAPTPRTPLPSRRRFLLITESSLLCCSLGPFLWDLAGLPRSPLLYRHHRGGDRRYRR